MGGSPLVAIVFGGYVASIAGIDILKPKFFPVGDAVWLDEFF
jgi:hypothetical protein